MQEKVARRCSKKKLSLKLHKICRKIPVLESLPNTVKGLQVIRLATLLKRNPHTSVLEPAVLKCFLKYALLNNSQNSQESACVGVFFNKVAGPQNCNIFRKKLL